MTDQETYRRRAARVLVIDGSGRVLLLRCWTDPAKPELGHLWYTPGGGVDEGESLAQAAARELREEIGLVVDPADLGDPVAHTSGFADLGWAVGTFRDDFFHHRVDGHDVDTSGMEAHERTGHTGHRWWSPEELAVTTDTVRPFELAALLTALAADPRPRQPHRLPWHH